jgi:hypothetical protein
VARSVPRRGEHKRSVVLTRRELPVVALDLDRPVVIAAVELIHRDGERLPHGYARRSDDAERAEAEYDSSRRRR